jgi:hypothetical protein
MRQAFPVPGGSLAAALLGPDPTAAAPTAGSGSGGGGGFQPARSFVPAEVAQTEAEDLELGALATVTEGSGGWAGAPGSDTVAGRAERLAGSGAEGVLYRSMQNAVAVLALQAGYEGNLNYSILALVWLAEMR